MRRLVISNIQTIVADAVLIGRTWVVYQGQLIAIAMPCALLFAGFGSVFSNFGRELPSAN
jgi:hypothetical protein